MKRRIRKELLDELLAGYEKPEDLTGPEGLLKHLTGALVERSLGAELTDHLGHEPGAPSVSGNAHNGTSPKTPTTDQGQVLAQGDHRTQEPQNRRRVRDLLRWAEGLPAGDRSGVPADHRADLHRSPDCHAGRDWNRADDSFSDRTRPDAGDLGSRMQEAARTPGEPLNTLSGRPVAIAVRADSQQRGVCASLVRRAMTPRKEQECGLHLVSWPTMRTSRPTAN